MQDAHRAGKGFRGGKTRRRSFSHFMRESGGFILSERHVGAVHRGCAAALADDVIPHHPCGEKRKKALRGFQGSPARLADKRPSRPASCQSPPPKAFPALGIHPASGLTSLLFRKRCSISHNASSFQDYREIHQFSQPKLLAIRSPPKMQRRVSDLSASPRQGVQRESVRLRPNGSLCTHCHDGVVRPDTEHVTKRR